MPAYKYRAKQGPDAITEGVIEADSEQEAVDKVSQMGLFALSVTTQAVQPDARREMPAVRSVGRIPGREITVVSRQLASLLKSGVPILTSINIIAEQADNANIRVMLRWIHSAVKDGATFSSSLALTRFTSTQLFLT